MLQILPIAFAQAKAGNRFENLINEKSIKSYILCIERRKVIKRYI